MENKQLREAVSWAASDRNIGLRQVASGRLYMRLWGNGGYSGTLPAHKKPSVTPGDI